MAMIGPLKLKAQLLCGDAPAMGPGKAELLETIARVGSIAGAARELGMSYRRAWILVDEMNRCWVTPLVEARSGGGARSGARLTECGRRVLDAYRGLESSLASAAACEDLQTLKTLLRPAPM